MQPPPSLRQYRDDNRGAQASDDALVKYRGLRGLLARLLFFVPIAGSGITVTMTNDGPLWSAGGAGSSGGVWSVSSARKIAPGTVGGRMPTYLGTRLDNASVSPLPGTGDYGLYFKLTWSVTFDTAGAISAYSLSTVEVVTTSGSDTATVKYLQFGARTGGVFAAPFYSASLSVALCQSAANATTMTTARL